MSSRKNILDFCEPQAQAYLKMQNELSHDIIGGRVIKKHQPGGIKSFDFKYKRQ